MDRFKGLTGRPFTFAALVEMGVAPAEIRQAVRRGEWIRMRRHVYVTAEDHARAAIDSRTKHALEIECMILALSYRDLAAVEASAARIHGLDLLNGVSKEMVLCTSDAGASSTHRDGYFLRASALPAHHIVTRHDVPVATVARTLLDLAANNSFAVALVATESALRQRLVTADELRDVLEWAAGRPGVADAREAFAFADPATESVLESVSRVTMRDLEIPMPRTQSTLTVDGAAMRVDFDWAPELDLVGEADGIEKYLPNGGADRTATVRAIRAEKEREGRLLRVRGEVVRWGWREANDSTLLGAILLPALARAEARARSAS